jgi:ABC-type transporter lipoprotein component MlaA/pimeloyl-ACP methyl ester carboxylesterase
VEEVKTIKVLPPLAAPARIPNTDYMRTGRLLKSWLLLLLSAGLPLLAQAQAPAAGFTNPAAVPTVVLPPSVPDPIEPFNRAMWAFNKGLMTGFVKPTSRVYRFVIVKPVRTSIGNFGRNLTYPGRLINNLLQQKWRGAWDESHRFVCNTTVGVAGFFDVATQWKIPKSDADFGQTFGQWGWQPACFIMLPVFGPSNERDTVGLAADTAANPLLYVAPYNLDANNPLTYLGPYSYFTYADMYNNMSDTVDEYVRFSRAEPDPYSEIQYAWTFARANRVADYQVKGRSDPAALETIESVFFTFQNPEFPNHAETASALIPATGRKLKFTYWLQPGRAPVVYIMPGLGSHRLAQSSLALAELVYKNGFSAVSVSSPFNAEFMENAASTALPAYLPADGHDLQTALTEIDRRLQAMYPGRFGDKALLGDSMGAFDALYLAATEPTNQTPRLKFDRYVAISPPVQLLAGVAKLDEYYQAPLGWPAAERMDDIENTFLKVAALSKTTLTPKTTLPFDAIESKFLIGLNFRFILRDVIYSSQRRNNQGVLQHTIRNYRREPVYREILQYSYQDYFDKFVTPYYAARGMASPVAETIARAGDLRTYTAGLRANPGIRVIVNQNDFLLPDADLAWLKTTFVAPQQLTVFKQGGHLGNLTNPTVQKTILDALSAMK